MWEGVIVVSCQQGMWRIIITKGRGGQLCLPSPGAARHFGRGKNGVRNFNTRERKSEILPSFKVDVFSRVIIEKVRTNWRACKA